MHYRLLSKIFAVLAAFIGAVVIFGWLIHSKILVQVLPTLAPMQFNTALLMLVSALSLVAHQWNRRILSWVLSVSILIFSALSLSQYMFELDLGIDQLFHQHAITTRSYRPGRMAPNTAISFILLSMGLIVINFKKFKSRSWIAASFAVFTCSFGFVSLIGYLVSLEQAYGWGNLTDMAIHTGVGFIFLSLALYMSAFTYNKVGKLDSWVLFPLLLGTMTSTLMLWRSIEIARLYAQINQQLFLLDPIVIVTICLLFSITIWLMHISVKNSIKLEDAQQHEEMINLEKTNILRYVSHEIRNPLNVIMGYSEPLEADDRSAVELINQLASIYRSADNIKSIVNDLLSWSTIESGKIDLKIEKIELMPWVESLRSLLVSRAEAKNIKFAIEVNPNCPSELENDSSKLIEIVSNFFDNAIKYTKSGGSIKVFMARKGDNFIIAVKDSGTGIPNDKIALIFHPFMQAHSSDSKKGLGLGLAICKQFLDAMGGGVEVSSKVGVGTTMTCSIPLRIRKM